MTRRSFTPRHTSLMRKWRSLDRRLWSGDDKTLTSEFKINRNDWGMTYGKGKVDDIVSLKVVVNAKK